MKLNPQRVHELYVYCQFKPEEIKQGKGLSKTRTIKLLTITAIFHVDRVKQSRKEIGELLLELPDMFMESKGGGFTFLDMCLNNKGDQWTGNQKIQEELLGLGLVTEFATLPLEKKFWVTLPGGMPYVVIHDRRIKGGQETPTVDVET